MQKNVMILSVFVISLTITCILAEAKASQNNPMAFLPEQTFEFKPVVEGVKVVHEFVLQNTGTALLEIKKLKSG